jgi:prevent-host-death family protein
MSEVGAYEAKTHLSELLERVQKGERFVITKHGRPVAELVPFRKRDPGKIRGAIESVNPDRRWAPNPRGPAWPCLPSIEVPGLAGRSTLDEMSHTRARFTHY